jgi:hypothetical protein
LEHYPSSRGKDNNQAKYSRERDFYCEKKEAFIRSDSTSLKRDVGWEVWIRADCPKVVRAWGFIIQ